VKVSIEDIFHKIYYPPSINDDYSVKRYRFLCLSLQIEATSDSGSGESDLMVDTGAQPT
jgi:hypothetical protein